MRKKLLLILIVITILNIVGCSKTNKQETRKEDMKELKAIINDIEYYINLEENETAKEFIKMLPKEYTMNELNGNEKYTYLDKSLPTDSYNPNQINKGDIMLFGDNCLVIFYKTFNTNYSYTKIGHIENLPDLDSNNIKVIFRD